MSALIVEPPFEIFTDIDGQPLEAGYVWVGAANLDPQVNPINVYWDEALTISAPQPLRTIGGYIVNSGTPAKIYVDAAAYSIRVMNKNGSTLYTLPNATGIDPSAFGIEYDPPFTGSVPTTVGDKLAETISVKDFGAVGDGLTDDTAALVAAAAALQDGQELDFGNGTYLISYQGTPYSSVNGNVVMDFLNKRDIALVGNSATIKVVNHDITTYGGLTFTSFKGCKRVLIEGLNFDMTFVGTNTSGSFYPFCGAITMLDEDAPTPAFSTLNSDFIIDRCTFKLFHPWGNWATTSNPFAGDPNNGYKLYSVFASAPFTPTQYDNQCRNIAVTNCTFLKGHNGYGIWFWAWNNCRVSGCVAEAWVTKHSNTSGTYIGGGVAMIRHIPFRTEGIVVENNEFRSMPTAERTAGFEGISTFYVHANNMGSIGWGKGLSVVSNNNIILGTGSISGGSGQDSAVFFNGFGQLIVANNNIDGHDGQDPAVGTGVQALELFPGGFGGGDNGVASIAVTDNIFGPWNFGGVFFTNGSNTSAAARRCKSLVVTNNTFSSGDFFLRMAGFSTLTHEGCQSTVISGNIVQSINAPQFPPPSVNNYGIFLAATEATDSVIVCNNVIRDKTYGIQAVAGYTSTAAQIRRFDNQFTNVTTPFFVQNFPFDVSQNVEVIATSNNGTYQPRMRCINTESTPVEVQLYQQASTSLLLATNRLDVYTDAAGQTVTDLDVFRPFADNTKNLGDGSFRWANVYAGNGSIITTSDEREKQQVQDIDAAALRAWGRVNYQQFKFNDAVEKKGDGARWHIGVIAQRVKEAFEAEGVDPVAFGILCYDEWEDQYQDEMIEVEEVLEDGKVIKKLQSTGNQILVLAAGNRYSIRYEEALALECAYLRSKLGV
jgi:hypothetical protein